MLNLLDSEAKTTARAFYRKRLITVAAWLVVVTSLAGLAALVPSYLLGHAEEALLQASQESQVASGSAAAVASTSAELSALAPAPRAVEPIIAEVVSAQVTGIVLDSFSYSPNPDILSVSGMASDRTTLVTFTEALQSEPDFTEVNLPVENLAKDSNIPFTLSLTLK